jgi:hypothetical protein
MGLAQIAKFGYYKNPNKIDNRLRIAALNAH